MLSFLCLQLKCVRQSQEIHLTTHARIRCLVVYLGQRSVKFVLKCFQSDLSIEITISIAGIEILAQH